MEILDWRNSNPTSVLVDFKRNRLKFEIHVTDPDRIQKGNYIVYELNCHLTLLKIKYFKGYISNNLVYFIIICEITNITKILRSFGFNLLLQVDDRVFYIYKRKKLYCKITLKFSEKGLIIFVQKYKTFNIDKLIGFFCSFYKVYYCKKAVEYKIIYSKVNKEPKNVIKEFTKIT